MRRAREELTCRQTIVQERRLPGGSSLERGVLHELPADLRQQRGPGAGLDQGGVQEARRQLPVPPRQAPRTTGTRTTSTISTTSSASAACSRPSTSWPTSAGPGSWADARPARRRRDDGALPRRHLPDGRSEGQEDRPLAEPEHGQDRLVGHPGGTGHRADAPAQRHDPQGRADRRVPLPGRLVRQARDDGPAHGEPVRAGLRRDHKHDLAFRPLETALEKGVIDAMYMQSGPLQQLSEATGKFKSIEDLSRYPDWTLQVANIPAAITCTDVHGREAPRAGRRAS